MVKRAKEVYKYEELSEKMALALCAYYASKHGARFDALIILQQGEYLELYDLRTNTMISFNDEKEFLELYNELYNKIINADIKVAVKDKYGLVTIALELI